MAAYAAVISLSNTIDRLLNHNQISISPEQKQQLISLLEHANSFEAFLEEFPDKFNNLEGRMRDLAHEAEDIIEYLMVDKFNCLMKGQMRELAHEAEDTIEYYMLDQVSYFQKVIMTLLKKKIINIHSKEYERGADSPAALATSSTAPPIRKHSTGGWFPRFIHLLRRKNKQKQDRMVRFEDLVIDLKDRLCGESPELQVIPICGKAGIGKTTLARYLYHDPLIMEHFEIRIWVKASQYEFPEEILSSILESLEEYVKGQSYNKRFTVYKILRGRRYLVVMDDIQSSQTWDAVRLVFPDKHNGSRIMLTTRSSRVASNTDPSSKLYEMVLLNEDDSWDFLKRMVFGDKECPFELENIGKEIARSCQGWPLALAMIGGILSTTTRTCASWKEWAEEYRDEYSRCYQHQLHLEKVIDEIDLIAGEVREIKDSSSFSQDVQSGVASSCAALSSSLSTDSTINNNNNVQLSAALHHQVMSMKKSNNINGVLRGAASSATLSSSSIVPPIHKDVMVGFEDNLIDLKDRLCGQPSRLQVIPICGMGGIGKTTLARNLYHDPLIVSRFDVRVWVTISQDYSPQRILSSLVESLKEFDKGGLGHSDDEKVHKILFGRRYLIVMDDIWSSEAWDDVRRVLPDNGNGSRVMLTTRLSDVASYPDPSSKLCQMSLLTADESWNLLKQNVFGDEDCPSELQDIGKKIARSCKGLPLAIVVIAGLLFTSVRSLFSWKVIAKNVKSVEHDQVEEILYLSYVNLPQYLRPCFLYMGFFPEDVEIHVKRLIRLWVAEGFIKSSIDSDSFEKVAEECLEELVKRNLVLVTKRKWDGRIKSCSMHDLMRDLCIRKSHESKFFLNMRDSRIGKESFIENIRNQRRISVDSSNLGFFSSLHGSTIRSIKCSQNHSIFYFGGPDFLECVKLLRVLDGGPFYVEDLPILVHLDELFHLRYLAIASHGEFPLCLSRLQNLQTLVFYHVSDVTSSLQLKWCMSQLRHVYYHGRYYGKGIIEFEDPKEIDCPLESLQTLSYVSLSTCRETILKMIPNLKELQINCSEGLPSDGGVCLDDLVHLHRLETLEIYGGKQVKYYKVTFPRMLKKLILRRWKLPWNDIFVFGSLPNLQVLKLIDCACVGGTWETIEGAFPVLEVLKISSMNFENWITESSHFPRLKTLQLHSCWRLKGIPNDIGEIPTLQLIEVNGLKGCARKSMISSLNLIREEQEEMGNNTLQVVHSETATWDYFFVHDSKVEGDDDDDDDEDDDDEPSP